jgi:hypothetical protein
MYKAGLAGTAVVALGTAVYVNAPYANGQVYPLPEAEVYQRLIDMEMPPELKNTIHDSPGADLDVEARPGEGIHYTLRQNGTMALRMIARITAESATSTRVKVDFEVGDIVALERDRPGSAAREIKALESDPIIQGVVRIALQEQVSATLEGRQYNKEKVQREAMVFVTTNPAAVAALKSKVKSAEYDARMARLQMSDEDRYETYRRDVSDRRDWVNRQARPGRPMMSGRPMVDPRTDQY